MKPLKFVISGGGTGGHIFPAIAIANAIKLKYTEADILFIGAKGKMEMEKVPAAGYKIIGLWVSGLQRKLTFKNILFLIKVIMGLLKAWVVLLQFKPNVVIGVGGYASGPTLRMASLMGIPTMIQEQNSFPGLTNRMLSKRTSKICVAYSDMERFFPANKIVLTGNPIRQDIKDITSKKHEALAFFNLSIEKKIVLIIGGSLGALTLNNCILSSLSYFDQKNIQIIWQTGKSFFPTANDEVCKLNNENIKVFPFISSMELAFAAADIIISRAGAISISELCVVGKPAILIPSPNVTDDHQTKNAMALVGNNAAIMIKDAEVHKNLLNVLQNVLNNIELQALLSQNIVKLAITSAADDIAEIALQLAKSKNTSGINKA